MLNDHVEFINPDNDENSFQQKISFYQALNGLLLRAYLRN